MLELTQRYTKTDRDPDNNTFVKATLFVILATTVRLRVITRDKEELLRDPVFSLLSLLQIIHSELGIPSLDQF